MFNLLKPFDDPWFGMASLTSTVEFMEYVPDFLESQNIFTPDPVRTYNLMVERSSRGLALVPTSELGAPPTPLTRDGRDMVALTIPRIAQDFTIHSHELIGLRGFGEEDTFANYQDEYVKRFNKMQEKRRLTEENHRLGAVQGVVMDADGVSVIHDYYDIFGVTKPAAITLSFSNPEADLKREIEAIVTGLVKTSRGALTPQSQIHAICGQEFYDGLRYHPSVLKWLIGYAEGAARREASGPYGSFTLGGITFHNYRGTDDGSKVAIPADKARVYPVGGRDVFTRAMGPSEFIGGGNGVNQLGREFYAFNETDPGSKQAWAKGELYGYSLFFCQRPDLLREVAMG